MTRARSWKYQPAKYRSKKTEIDGITFDSRKEAARYAELKILEKGGVIKDLALQVPFVLIPAQYEKALPGKKRGKLIERACIYKADFVYQYDGETIVEDVKGLRTKEYIIKRKLMLKVHGIRIRET